MRLTLFPLLLSLFACAPAAPLLPSSPPTSPSGITVSAITDGDTIEVRGAVTGKVRYIGIDTPERDDWLYAEATRLNRDLVYGKSVRLEADVSDKDRYGRFLRFGYVNDTFVNAELVKAGLARASAYPPDVKFQALFSQLESEAARAGRGLWALPQVTNIFYDGVKSGEPDEYVEIRNFGTAPINMTGWKLKDDYGHTFTFPNYSISPGKTIRVYTNEDHPEWGGFSFKSTSPIWGNRGGEAILLDGKGTVVSRYSYRPK